MNKLAALFLALTLSGCGFQGAASVLGPLLSTVGNQQMPQASLVLQIDQAHGTLTMGSQPAATMVMQGGTIIVPTTNPPVVTPAKPGGTIVTPTP